MPFNMAGFMKAKFEPRTAEVRVPKLKDWFGEDEEPIIKVKGLDATEYARIQQIRVRHANAEAVIRALTNQAEQIEVLKETIGLIDDETPEDYAKRLETLVIGCIEPEFTLAQAQTFAQRFIIDFYVITNKIYELTGLGMDVKKPQPSGKTEKSE